MGWVAPPRTWGGLPQGEETELRSEGTLARGQGGGVRRALSWAGDTAGPGTPRREATGLARGAAGRPLCPKGREGGTWCVTRPVSRGLCPTGPGAPRPR